MPNWATSEISFIGATDDLATIKEQLSKPYTCPVAEEEQTGAFLLWNIVSPDDFYSYTGKDLEAFAEIVKANPDLADNRSIEEKIAEFKAEMASGKWQETVREQIATGKGWYEWNVRNWGTKWEVNEDSSEIIEETTTQITYRIITAWNSPVEALTALAVQFPKVAITLDAIDESDCWAMTAFWSDGQLRYSDDAEITHDLHIRLLGECWACEGNDPEYAEDRASQGCPDEQA